jgi:hypothetical protein
LLRPVPKERVGELSVLPDAKGGRAGASAHGTASGRSSHRSVAGGFRKTRRRAPKVSRQESGQPCRESALASWGSILRPGRRLG